MAFIELLLKRMLLQLLSNCTHVAAHDDAGLLPKRISSMQLLRNCTPVAEAAVEAHVVAEVAMEHAACLTLLILKIAAHANKLENKLPSPKR